MRRRNGEIKGGRLQQAVDSGFLEQLIPAKKIVLDALRLGLSIDGAAGLAGVSRARFNEWRVIDRDFDDEISNAIAQCEDRVVRLVDQALESDPKLAFEFLKHRFPQRWGTSELRLREEERLAQQYEQMLMQSLNLKNQQLLDEYERRARVRVGLTEVDEEK